MDGFLATGRPVPDLSFLSAALARGPSLAGPRGSLRAAGVWPLPGSTLDLDFINNRGWARGRGQAAATSLIESSGGINGTVVNAAGVIEAAVTPRRDFDPATLVCKGLLNEEPRTNLLLRSQEFNAVWSSSANVTANQVIAPDGTLTADKWTLSGSGQGATQAVTATSTSVTLSVYMRQGTASTFNLLIRNSTTSTNICNYLFTWATLAASNASGTGSATFENVGNGWVRATLTVTTGITIGDAVIAYIYTCGTAGLTGDYAYPWGAQLEAGVFATSYIPTTSAAVTRAADVASMTGTNFSSWFNPVQGTFVMSVVPKGLPSSTNWRPLEAANAAATDRNPLLYITAAGAARVQYRSGGADQALFNTADGAVSRNTRLQMATAYADSNFAVSFNGAAAVTDGAGTLGSPDRLTIGWATSAPNEVFNGWIERIAYFPQRLSNSHLPALAA